MGWRGVTCAEKRAKPDWGGGGLPFDRHRDQLFELFRRPQRLQATKRLRPPAFSPVTRLAVSNVGVFSTTHYFAAFVQLLEHSTIDYIDE